MLGLVETNTPAVMETHGGAGRLFRACYSDIQRGIVFEKDPEKSSLLAQQRPTWSVYECDCVTALRAGIGSHVQIDILDIDPYGEPWPVLDAFLQSERPLAPTLFIVVNDGLRQKVRLSGGWNVHSLDAVVSRFGNKLASQYLEVCEYLMKTKATEAGYHLSRFTGYYCGHGGQMTHYLARLDRVKPPVTGRSRSVSRSHPTG